MNLSKSFATTVVSIVYAIDLREASKSFFMEYVRKEVEERFWKTMYFR